MMRKSCLQGYEVRDRPRIVKPRSEKLPGKALSVSLHIRLMPYVIWRLLGEPEEKVDNELLDLLGILHSSLNDFLHADKVNFADIRNLEDLVVNFFKKRKICSTKFMFQQLMPKYHFLEHYPSEIRRFGPLNGYWAARCESKHREFVNWAESAKNFINLPKTLAVKHQRLLVSR